MKGALSRREFLISATAAAGLHATAHSMRLPGEAVSRSLQANSDKSDPNSNKADSNDSERIVDCHVHFDQTKSSFVEDLVKLCTRINLTACVLTPYINREVVADAAKRHPTEIIPIGFLDLDARDVVQQAKEFHKLGYRGLGELEFVKKPLIDPGYFPVYELANEYGWPVLFHTGIVLRKKFDEPEDVASHRMRAFYLEEIARRFPRITVIGAHCGNPEYEWAAEVSRWNPNVFFDLSGSTLTKMRDRLSDFRKIFWWTGTEWGTNSPGRDPSAFSKLVFGSDTGLDQIEGMIGAYRSLFQACGVPEHTQKLIMGGTLAKIFKLAP
jgi:hypothetical protein